MKKIKYLIFPIITLTFGSSIVFANTKFNAIILPLKGNIIIEAPPTPPKFTWSSYFQAKGCNGDINPIVENGAITCYKKGLNESDANYPDEVFPVSQLSNFTINTANMPTMKNLTGLTEITTLNLTNVGAVSLDGLRNVNKIDVLTISNNPNLQNLDGFQSLTELEKHADLTNNNLTNLDGFSNVTKGLYRNEMSEPSWEFNLSGNANLTDISGISKFSIKHTGRGVYFTLENATLTTVPDKNSPFCINEVYKGWGRGGTTTYINYDFIKSTCES